MRNTESVLPRYFNKLESIVNTFPEHNFYLSIYENDSTDDTQTYLLKNTNTTMFKGSSIVCAKIGTPFYNSYQNGVNDRIKNLANARNMALFAKDMYLSMDKVLWIEPDVDYQMELIDGLINFDRPADIVSGISLYPNMNPPPDKNSLIVEGITYILCDTWASRRTPDEEYGDIYPDLLDDPIKPYYTTFNCVVLYNAEPFKKGAKFHWFNEATGKVDCDTAVVCLNFRKLGYDKIYINQGVACLHDYLER